MDLVAFAAGLALLFFGAEWTVRGAARLARTLGLSALLVGLTIVALGTSAPELVVSGFASARNVGDLAFGNVLGSNIVNIALILGLAAVFSPMRVRARLVSREIPIMIAAAVVLAGLVLDGSVARSDGVLLLVAFLLYMVHAIRGARRPDRTVALEWAEFEDAEKLSPDAHGPLANAALTAVGIVGLAIGAELMVDSAVSVASALGISELVIGLTIVSIGTSLPELATVVVAGFRKESDIALGNAVGSNIFNVLAILGVAAVVRPIGVAPTSLRFELPAMLLISLLLLPFARTRFRLDRWEGAVLIGCYIAFTVALLVRHSGLPVAIAAAAGH